MNNVYVRILTYVTSLLLGSVPAVALGWFEYSVVDGVISMKVQIEGAVTAIVSALGLAAGVFKIWGTK